MRRERYVNQLEFRNDAELITQNKHIADLFGSTTEICGNPKLVSN